MRKMRIAGTLLIALSMAGCNSDDADQLAKVARTSRTKIQQMTGGAPDRLAGSIDAMRANWNEIALDTRVALRLRWDKDLEGTAIEVHANNGVVELGGTVTKMTQRQRAVQLARTTVGVTEVVDALQIGE
jgi:osmotically-inducible protein OsmY